MRQAVVWSIPVSSYCFGCVTPCSLLSEERPRRRWCHRWESRFVAVDQGMHNKKVFACEGGGRGVEVVDHMTARQLAGWLMMHV